jgi:uncharacterized protein
MTPLPVFVLAPGAGAPSSSPWMQRFATYLAKFGTVETFDYPYQVAGRKYPDRLPVLLEAHKAAILRAQVTHGGPIILVGKSMGSRMGCHASLETPVAALVCFGYPLFGAGDPSKRRDDVLRELKTPTLFIQGTRDALCPLDTLRPLLQTLTAQTELHIVDGGDHSLQVTRTHLKRHQLTQDAIEQTIMHAIAAFVAKVCSAIPGPTS